MRFTVLVTQVVLCTGMSVQALVTEKQSCHQALRLLLTETQHTSKREKKGHEAQEDFVAERAFPDAVQPKWPCLTRHTGDTTQVKGVSRLGHLNIPLDRWRAEGEPSGGVQSTATQLLPDLHSGATQGCRTTQPQPCRQPRHELSRQRWSSETTAPD